MIGRWGWRRRDQRAQELAERLERDRVFRHHLAERYDPPDMLRMMAEAALAADPAKPIPEAVVDELRQIFALYGTPCPFKPGDLVTPRRGRPVRGADEPHIVLEVFDPPLRGPATKADSGAIIRIDMRVACWIRGHYDAFPAESWHYERWEGASC